MLQKVNKRISKSDFHFQKDFLILIMINFFLNKNCFLLWLIKILLILDYKILLPILSFQMFRIFYRKCLGPIYTLFSWYSLISDVQHFLSKMFWAPDILFSWYSLFRCTEFSFENVWAPEIFCFRWYSLFRCSEFSIENVWAPEILCFHWYSIFRVNFLSTS